MAEGIRIPARSNNGCWTCRLRRKKCDESRPVCSACIALELECHGYGPRPRWMDNGILQRNQASKVRDIVSQAKSRKSKRRTSSAPRPQSNSVSLPPHENGYAPPVSSFSHPTGDESCLAVITQTDLCHPDGGADFNYFADLAWRGRVSNGVYEAEPEFDLDRYSITPTSPGSHNPVQHFVSLAPWESTTAAMAAGPYPPPSQEFSSEFRPQDTKLENDERTGCVVDQIHPMPSSIFQGDKSYFEDLSPLSHAGSTQVWSQGVGTEDALFMYYLDQVFYVQYPFYQYQTWRGRGWLFSILRTVKPAYHAALALSERQLLSTPSRNGGIAANHAQLRAQSSHYFSALREVQNMLNDSYKSNGPTRLVYSLEILTSFLLLIFYEIFNGGNWQAHLRTACSFVPTLLQARIALTTEGSTDPNSTRQPPPDIPPHPEVESAINALISSFITFDILSCASTRSAPLLSINHTQVLSNLDISLEPLTGCRNSIMALVLEISLLDNWKKEAQDNRRLSIVDLAKRGEHIEERLRAEIASMGAVTWASMGPQLEINRVFALSAITYLHVVISGAYPELPDIADSVSETILAFKNLKDPKSLRYMAWPLCITGCLSPDSQRGFFRDLAHKAGVNTWATRSCVEALHIMEECWKARSTSSETCDWATTMKQRGHYVLLK